MQTAQTLDPEVLSIFETLQNSGESQDPGGAEKPGQIDWNECKVGRRKSEALQQRSRWNDPKPHAYVCTDFWHDLSGRCTFKVRGQQTCNTCGPNASTTTPRHLGRFSLLAIFPHAAGSEASGIHFAWQSPSRFVVAVGRTRQHTREL